MKQFQRQELILDLLKHGDAIEIPCFVDQTGASASTVRRDLRALEREGRIISLRGGAVRLDDRAVELPVTAKSKINSSEKDAIAATAAHQVYEGETIYLDSGTTLTAMLRHLSDKRIHIVTSNTHLLSVPLPSSLEITVLGGDYLSEIGSVAGPLTDRMLEDLYFDRAFIGVSGLSTTASVTTFDMREANKKRLVKEHSRTTYVLADSSKFSRTSLCRAFDISEGIVITDAYDELLLAASSYILANHGPDTREEPAS